jgi:hypothetical protein
MKISTTYQNLWDTTNTVLRGKFTAINANIKNIERSQIHGLILQHKFLEKQEQAKPKTSRRREIIKINTKINEIEAKQNHTKNQ